MGFGAMYSFGHSVPMGFLRSDRTGEKVHEQDQAHPNPRTKRGVPASLGSPRAALWGRTGMKSKRPRSSCCHRRVLAPVPPVPSLGWTLRLLLCCSWSKRTLVGRRSGLPLAPWLGNGEHARVSAWMFGLG